MSLKILSLAFVICLASGEISRDASSIFSRLHKKAVDEGRPLILIVDKNTENHNDHHHTWHNKPLGGEERSVSLSLLDLLNNKRQSLKLNNQNSFDRPILNSHAEPKSSYDDLILLKYRLEREKQVRRERRKRRERKVRSQDRNIYTSLDRNDKRKERRERFEDRDLDRSLEREDKRKDRIEDISLNRREKRKERLYRFKNRNSDKPLDRIEKIGDRYDDRDNRADDGEQRNDKQVLRSAVIKNLLRISNDLNCEAKDECQDKCEKYKGKAKQNKCENTCDVKYDCQESEEDPCDENSDGGCGDSEEEMGSTMGERLVTVTAKCTRC